MICGNCKESNSTIEHVRGCYVKKYEEPALRKFADTKGAQRPLADWSGTEADLEGVYFKDGYYFKVVPSREGHWYAKVWESPLGNGQFEWTYQGRKPLYTLTLNDKVSPEQAAHFGHTTGSCVFCSRHLTDERSIAVGYGPVCAEREGLPWGDAE